MSKEKTPEEQEAIEAVILSVIKFFLTGAVLVPITAMVIGISIVAWSFNLMLAWNWFAPHVWTGFIEIGFVQSMCVYLILCMSRYSNPFNPMRIHYEMEHKDDPNWGIANLKSIGWGVISPLMSLAVILVFHWIIGSVEPAPEVKAETPVVIDEPQTEKPADVKRPWETE